MEGAGAGENELPGSGWPAAQKGPYGALLNSLRAEIDDTRVGSIAVLRYAVAVRREGAAQIALVGPPNVGKSSLLQALSQIQIKTGDFPFTTLRPIPALTRIGGVLVQLVEIPGPIEGAHEGRGGGRGLGGGGPEARARLGAAHARDPAPADLWGLCPLYRKVCHGRSEPLMAPAASIER